MNDTHDQLMQAVLKYLKASEEFERGPSERTKRNARRTLRELMSLAKLRQDEVKEKYMIVLEEIRASGKWSGENRKPKKAKKNASDNT